MKEPRALIAADLSGSGAPELLATQAGGTPLLLQNQGGNKNHSLQLALTGLADNKSAIGTKVEVFAGGLWQKFEVAGGSGYLSQGSTQILAGLGKRTTQTSCACCGRRECHRMRLSLSRRS